jgi:hypothetical protein
MTPAFRDWLRLGGASLLLLGAVACSPGTPTTGPASRSPEASPAATATDPGLALLTAVLAPIRLAATFESTVTVGDAVAISSTGRIVGEASRTTVKREDRTVEYVQVPPGAWARDTGGKWVLVTADQAPGNPLDVLGAPTSVESAAEPAAGGTRLVATYPAEALGLSGEAVRVTIVIDGDAVTFRYETTVGEATASSETTLRPDPSPEPIVPPTG